jgi:hypothetical protein
MIFANRVPKPRISFCRMYRDWICTDRVYTGIGKTPEEAYASWNNRPDWCK